MHVVTMVLVFLVAVVVAVHPAAAVSGRLALRAERDELYQLRRANSIGDEVHQQLLGEIDLMEASLMRSSAH